MKGVDAIWQKQLKQDPPFLPKKATVMMMGTSSQEQSKRAHEFHYPKFPKDMACFWPRIL